MANKCEAPGSRVGTTAFWGTLRRGLGLRLPDSTNILRRHTLAVNALRLPATPFGAVLHMTPNILADRPQTTVDAWAKHVQAEENAYYWKGVPHLTRGLSAEVVRPTCVELFSGCGGTSLGFEMAGFHVLLGVDIHGPSIATFHHNHPSAATILGDVRKVDGDLLERAIGSNEVDVLIAGIPCQGFSLNNRKRSDADERNFLYHEFIRLLRIVRPQMVVVENVSGMRSAGQGEFVRNIASDIEAAAEMRVTSAILHAEDFGVPQRRARLVFVGVKDEPAFDFTSIERTHGPGGTHPFTTVADALSDLPSLAIGEEARAYASVPRTAFQQLMRRGAGALLTNHRAPKHPTATIERIASTQPGRSMYPRFKQRIRLSWDDLSPTQVAGGIRPQFQFGHPADARGLSIRERCRLQSFPDTFRVHGGIVQGRVQTGNAVPPLLARALARALKTRL